MPLYARRSGSGDPVVVLLHGFGGSGAIWEAVEPLIAPRASILTYDLPGHGRSADSSEWSSPSRMARAIGEDMAERGLTSVYLVGHSLGGAVATLIASGKPEFVASLTLVAPGGMGAKINAPLLHRFALASDEATLSSVLQEMSGKNSKVGAEEVALHVAWRSVPENRERLAQLVERIAPEDGQGAFPKGMLAALSMPVAVVWGKKDDVLPVGQVENLPENFDVHLLEETGHMLPKERPDAVAHLIAAMIDRNSQDGDA